MMTLLNFDLIFQTFYKFKGGSLIFIKDYGLQFDHFRFIEINTAFFDLQHLSSFATLGGRAAMDKRRNIALRIWRVLPRNKNRVKRAIKRTYVASIAARRIDKWRLADLNMHKRARLAPPPRQTLATRMADLRINHWCWLAHHNLSDSALMAHAAIHATTSSG
jgi:hypothetical protein